MKKITLLSLLALNLLSNSAFAKSLVCTGETKSKVKISIATEGFDVEDYAGPATVKVTGLSSKFNVSTQATYVKAEHNNSNLMVVVPLKKESQGQLLLVFKDQEGAKASLQHISADDEYSVLAEVSCK